MGLFDGLFGGGGAAVNVGDRAPEFELPDASGKRIRLSDFLGRQSVVLYFYPKDDTPGCTKEACSFRDQYEAFKDAGAEVIGVSSDSEASHQKFATKYKLPFTLVADTGGGVCPDAAKVCRPRIQGYSLGPAGGGCTCSPPGACFGDIGVPGFETCGPGSDCPPGQVCSSFLGGAGCDAHCIVP
jgi:peroxiredoxin